MIIRNGFMRDVNGMWYNLDYIKSVYIYRDVDEEKNIKYVVHVDLMSTSGYYERVMSYLYDSEEDAQKDLDILMGMI